MLLASEANISLYNFTLRTPTATPALLFRQRGMMTEANHYRR
ncbi:uncharacterized protein METZ01_LOCUS265182 [marine metagenome]|uniref:Uncharacterized protein n=1 Tax=marine metagenome TaxID=408172 RepID=A0A382JKR5_9ZZZZ